MNIPESILDYAKAVAGGRAFRYNVLGEMERAKQRLDEATAFYEEMKLKHEKDLQEIEIAKQWLKENGIEINENNTTNLHI